MAHEIENMFYVGQIPWHQLGVAVAEAPSVAEAIKLAGLDWSVGLVPLQTMGGLPVDHKAVQRQSDQSILGVVGPEYKPLQNADAFKFFDPFVQSGEAKLETAGSLRDGKRIWILAKINREDSVIVPGADDRVAKYLLLSNSHDGTLAIRVGFTPIRVVCANTLAMAHGDGNSTLLKLKHRGDVEDTLNRVQTVINVANERFEATAEQYRMLASKQIDRTTLEKFVKIVFQQSNPLRTAEETAGIVQAADSGSRVLEKIVPLFERGRGNDLPGVKGTFWAAYNAVTEYVQHERGNSAVNRLDSAWLGAGMALNKKALATATELVKA